MHVDTNILPPRYQRPQRIGRGGMGDIYRAEDQTLGRAVAVKILSDRYAQDDAIRGRFTREALAAARLSGEPNIVTIFDVGEWQGRPFIVMEHLSGGSLDDRVRAQGAQPTGRVIRWLEQAATALDTAHARGVVHRDVKPANLLLDASENVHVADFGVASAAGLDSLTITGTILGTAGYLAPEQARGEQTTSASDRYALAVVAFELLTGKRPFEADSPTAEAIAHVHAPVPSVCDKLGSLPCELDPVFQRALAKEANARYPTCIEFVGALRRALDEAAGDTRQFAPVPSRLARAPVTSTRRRRRSSARLPIAIALLAGAAAGGAALASALTSDDGERTAGQTVEITVTRQGSVVEKPVTLPPRTVTETASAPTTAPTVPTGPATTPTQPPPGGRSVSEGRELTDQSTALNRAGRYSEALPVAQRALQHLQGSGEVYEAYANFNVGNALAGMNRCAEALPYLDRSEQIQGYRSEIAQLRARCRGR